MIKKGVDIRVGAKVRALEADADGATADRPRRRQHAS
jgi:hypothetical protein